MLNEKRKQELVELCQELLQKKSYSGEEGDVVKSISEAFKRMGFDGR